MDDVIDGAEIDVDCPDCGGVASARVGELRRSSTLRCPNGHEIEVDGSQLDADLRPADRAMAHFDRSIRNFGK
ncbi:MAG TPA: hypothetical protein VH025_07255 [Solirubrobacteraceae bacterium]|jgi:hypothetical protein|nr:hypothetical protein [Solirubrobacteraceae bacterium]